MFAVWSPLVCRGPIYPRWACTPSPLATQPGREGMHARKQSTAKHLLCNRVGSSPAERGSPCVFSAYCSQLLFHASPPSSCFAWGRKMLWKFLAASPFFSPSLLLPSLLVAIKNVMSPSQPFNPVFPPHTNVSRLPIPTLHHQLYPKRCGLLDARGVIAKGFVKTASPGTISCIIRWCMLLACWTTKLMTQSGTLQEFGRCGG